MARRVEAFVVESGRRDDVDSGQPAQLRKLADVAAGIAGHRVHSRPQTERRRGTDLGRHRRHVAQVEVGVQLDRPTFVDDEVFVGVRDPERAGVDVAEDGSHGGHQTEAAVTDQPPSIARHWPVTVCDSGERK